MIPILMLFLGTGETGWEQGIAALLVGLLMLIHPPQRGIPLPLVLTVGGFLVLAAVPLIPLAWPHRPDWWETLAKDLMVPLAMPWSAQPWVTLEAWVRTALFLLWMMWWITIRPSYDETRHLLRVLAGGIAAVAIAALIFHVQKTEPGWWNLEIAEQFGPLANRNVFAALMSLGSVAALAAAYDLQRRRSAAWILFALLLIPMFAVVVVSTSRAGIVILLLAVVLWFALSSLQRGAVQRMAVAISLVLAAASALVLFGRPLLNRFVKTQDSAITDIVKEDGRTILYLETLQLSGDHVGLGVGLGNFEDVFAMTRELPEIWERFRHPESDWLWLLFETGLPATGLLLLTAGLLLVRSLPRPGREGSSSRRGETHLRYAGLVVGCAAVLHSLMNPVLHALPFFLALAPFAGVAVPPERWARTKQAAASPALFRLSGLGLLVACGLWWTAETGGSTLFGQTTVRRQLAMAGEALDKGESAKALQACNRAIEAAPLHWAGWFDRASAKLAMGRGASEALADFAVARFVEPSLFSLPMEEARLLLNHRAPMEAVGAWREALLRAQSDSNLHAGLYATMLGELGAHPELRSEVRTLASTPKMLVQYLGQAADEEEIRATLHDLLELNPSLDQLTSHERRRVLSVWYEKGDRNQLMQTLETDPLLMTDGWQMAARNLAETGKPGDAYRMAMKNLKPPARMALESLRSPAEVQRDIRLNPGDPRPAMSLFHLQMKENRLEEAAATLAKVQGMPEAPRYLDYEFARVLAAQGDEAKAWEAIQRYMQNNPES